MWEFATEPEFQAKLDWMDEFIREHVEPLDLVFPGQAYTRSDPRLNEIIDALKAQVKEARLWACHLDPELGGEGYGQLKLALMNELLGRSEFAPVVFGCQAPDSGNAEILAMFGTEEQKSQYLKPLLAGECFSAFSMTEPHAGSDPRLFRCRAWRDGGDWVIDGEKYFTSHANVAEFYIVMAVTDPDLPANQGMSMFLVPADTPGITILRDVAVMSEPDGAGHHQHVRYDNVRVPAHSLLGEEGGAFAVSQARLGGGRIHHAMRTVAAVRLAFEMMCERALSRETVGGGRLADNPVVQGQIADCYLAMHQFRLLILHSAWVIDNSSTREARTAIAACKVQAARVYQDVVGAAVHLHGALGVSLDTPLADLWMKAPQMGIMDGPTEVHQSTIARRLLAEREPSDSVWPTRYRPAMLAAAQAKYGVATHA